MTTSRNNNQQPSLRSPKNRYHVSVNYPQPLEGIGSVVSFGTMDIENIEDYIRKYWMNNQPTVYVVIKENMKQYPSFDWQTVRTFNLDA